MAAILSNMADFFIQHGRHFWNKKIPNELQ